jgi:mono/diheme cytochrome c family protein
MRNFMKNQNFQLPGQKTNKGLKCCAVFFIAVLLLVITNTVCYSSEADQLEGAVYFKQMCVACHTINGGILVGPDLANVHDRRSDEWLLEFITSSQTFINSGDPDAVAVFEKFNKIVMPDPPFSNDQIVAIITYIKAASGTEAQSAEAKTAGDGTTASVDTSIGSTQEDIIMGQNLFQGKVRLENGGPACISCHDVKNDAVIGGGILARELTTVFSRMGEPGVRAILGSAPFPVMQQAYVNKSLTDEEIVSIVSFLEQADKDHMFQQPRDYGLKLAGTGIVGLIVLLVVFSLIWRKRKTKPVNKDIFDRQVKSQ